MIFHFLASSDIYRDYVGTRIISDGLISNTENLPAWTACKSEWWILQVDYIIRVIFMIIITIAQLFMIDNYKKKLSSK
jgi:hypothetical protein